MSFSALLDTGEQDTPAGRPPRCARRPPQSAPSHGGARAETIGEPVPGTPAASPPPLPTMAPPAPPAAATPAATFCRPTCCGLLLPAAAPARAHRCTFRCRHPVFGPFGVLGLERGAVSPPSAFAAFFLATARRGRRRGRARRRRRVAGRRLRAAEVPVERDGRIAPIATEVSTLRVADVRTPRRGALPRARGLREDPGDRSERSRRRRGGSRSTNAAPKMRAVD